MEEDDEQLIIKKITNFMLDDLKIDRKILESQKQIWIRYNQNVPEHLQNIVTKIVEEQKPWVTVRWTNRRNAVIDILCENNNINNPIDNLINNLTINLNFEKKNEEEEIVKLKPQWRRME